jgi:anaerobic selenocysteine-containing dehydrogenase
MGGRISLSTGHRNHYRPKAQSCGKRYSIKVLVCLAPSTVALNEMFGTNTSIVSLESLKEADCVVLAGANSPSNHPRLMNELIKIRDKGGKVIVINPVMEIGLVKFGSPAFPVKSLIPGSDIASLYLQPIPGSDVALFVGIQKALMGQGRIDRAFLAAHTEGWEAILAQAQSTSWETITTTCGVSRAEIETAATIIGTSKRVVFGWAMGITQQTNGVDNVFSIANTAYKRVPVELIILTFNYQLIKKYLFR